MASTSETGHAINVANFHKMIAAVTSYGEAYNPSNASINLNSLESCLALALENLDAVNTSFAGYKYEVAKRRSEYDKLSKLTTRIINSLKASGTGEHVVRNARTIIRKIQGKRATLIITEKKKNALKGNQSAKVEISSSQMSYDSRLENFRKLIVLLERTALYNPNETDLKITSLLEFSNKLEALNSSVRTTFTKLSNARVSRNAILYKENTGLVDISVHVKTYLKSLYGAGSPQYRQVSKLLFISFS